MKPYQIVTRRQELTVYPIVCMHVGAKQCAEDFIKKHVQRVLDDENGIAVYMGDGGECNIKSSKGDIYEQTLSPGEQLDYAEMLLKPLADAKKLAFGIEGNHGRRILKEVGINWDQELMRRLQTQYLGTSALVRFKFKNKDEMCRISYDTYWHHGAGAGTTIGGNANRAMKFNNQVEVDAVFTAHVHRCMALDVENIAFMSRKAVQVKWRQKHHYICGCAYDSRSGYAEEKGLSPVLPAYLSVSFNGRDTRSKKKGASRTVDAIRHQNVKIFRDHPNTYTTNT